MKILLIVGVAIIVSLSVVATYYVYALYKLKESQKHKVAKQERLLNERRKSTINSLVVIAQAMLEKQMPIAEGAIRVSVLLEGLSLTEEEKQPYISCYKLAQSISHIPILDEWKKLPRQQKREYEQHIETQELHFRDFVLDAAKHLLENKGSLR